VITPWTGVTKGRHIENALENKAINEILKQICSANEACHIFSGGCWGKDGWHRGSVTVESWTT